MESKQQVKKRKQENALIHFGVGASLMIGAAVVKFILQAWKDSYVEQPKANKKPRAKKSGKHNTSEAATLRRRSKRQQSVQSIQRHTKPFPWEAQSTNLNKSISTTPQPPRNMATREQQKEIDFLANMTFANGNFRGPSCPCCQ
jgi:hypothetical protein